MNAAPPRCRWATLLGMSPGPPKPAVPAPQPPPRPRPQASDTQLPLVSDTGGSTHIAPDAIGAGAIFGGIGAIAVFGTLLVAWLLRRHAFAYASLSRGEGGGSSVRVIFDLGEDLREDGEVSLGGLGSISALRQKLLQLADELLLDPEEDLGEWRLRYTDKTGVLLPVEASTSIADLRRNAQELRVTAGLSLR